jgi:hypothetical protein
MLLILVGYLSLLFIFAGCKCAIDVPDCLDELAVIGHERNACMNELQTFQTLLDAQYVGKPPGTCCAELLVCQEDLALKRPEWIACQEELNDCKDILAAQGFELPERDTYSK